MLDPYGTEDLPDGFEEDGEILPFKKVLKFPIKRAA
jgi:hypothetical protein